MSEMDQAHENPYASVAELLELGIFQEANRRFFHILGLELVVQMQHDGRQTLNVVDGRTELGGMTFRHDEETWSRVRRDRAERVTDLWNRQVDLRRATYGFQVQPTSSL